LHNIKLGIPCLVESTEGEENNAKDDEANNDLIHIAIFYTSWMRSHQIYQGAVNVRGIIFVFIKLELFMEPHPACVDCVILPRTMNTSLSIYSLRFVSRQ
jgi:hypothetical protein